MFYILGVILAFLLAQSPGIIIGLTVGWSLPTPTVITNIWSWFASKFNSLIGR